MRTTLLLTAYLVSTIVVGWGGTGHRVVARIASNHLTKSAREGVRRILGTESLEAASTWMDEIRSDPAYDFTHDWHWVTIPDGRMYASAEKNPHGDVVGAITSILQQLRSDTVSLESKRILLRLLVHLVGDIHQPLHVGRGDDKGGNKFQVQWMGKGSNLHRVWDSQMIEAKNANDSTLALQLDTVSEAHLKFWQQGTPAEWAEESIPLRAQIYDVHSGEELGLDYLNKNWPIVQEQLTRAGIRLAWLLNSVFQ